MNDADTSKNETQTPGTSKNPIMYSTDAPQFIEHVNMGLNFTPSDVKWIPMSSRFVAMGQKPNGQGAVNVYEIRPSETKCVQEWTRPSGVKCGTFGASFLEDRHLAYGDYSGNVVVLDLNTNQAIWETKGHEKIVNCIDGCGGLNIGYGAPEILTGSRDGCVKLWDTRVNGPVISLEPAEGQGARDCWTVAFGNSYSDDERCIVAGYDNGDLKIFDLRTQTMRWETNLGNGGTLTIQIILGAKGRPRSSNSMTPFYDLSSTFPTFYAVVSAQFDRKDIEMNKLVATTLESKFHVFDCRTQVRMILNWK